MRQIQFEVGQQKKFFDYSIQYLKINLRGLAEKLKINYELIKKYHQEKCLIEEKTYLKICKIIKLNPKSLKISYIERNWGQVIGGKKGYATLKEKYGGKFAEWRVKGGKNSKREKEIFKYKV